MCIRDSLRYAVPGSKSRQRQYDQPSSSYRFSSIDSTLWPADKPQTVDQVIASGYFSIPPGDPVTAIISDKRQTSWLGLDDVISQIRQRYEIYHQNLYEIELSKCAATNAIYRHEAYRGPASVSAKQHYAKHKAIQDLYEQERTERTSLWKDISRLKLQIPESAQLYLAAYRKVSVLAEGRGDDP